MAINISIKKFWHGHFLKDFIKNFSWLFSGQGITSLMSFVKGIMLARGLGVEVFGTYGIIISFVSIVNQFVDFRIGETLVRYLNKYLSEKDSDKALGITKLCYIIDFSTGILGLIIIVGISSLASNLFLKDPGFNDLITLYAIVLFVSTVNGTSEGILHIFNRFKITSVLSVAHSTLEICLVASVLLLEPNLKNVFIAMVIATSLYSFFLSAFAFKILKFNTNSDFFNARLTSLKTEFKEIFFFIFNTNLTSTLKMFATNVDVLLLGYITTAREVGIYKVATTIIGALYLPIVSFIKVLYPALSKLVSDKKYERFKALAFYSLGGSFVYGLVVVFFLWFFIDTLIVLLYGTDYLYAQYIFKLMSIGAVFGLVLSITRPLLLSVYDTITNNVSLFGMGFIWITLGPLSINMYGYNGAAIVYSVAIFLGALYSGIKVLQHNRRIENAVRSMRES